MAVEKTPAKAAKEEAEAPKKEELVFLYLGHPHTEFDLSGVGLENLVPEGTAYTPEKADLVRMMCLKYRVRFHEAE